MRLVALALAGIVLAPSLADAQPWRRHRDAPRTTGFTLGAGGHAVGLATESGGVETEAVGGGIGLRVGYGFSPSFALLLDLQGSVVDPEARNADEYGFGSAELAARFALRPSAGVNPYLQVGVGGAQQAFDVPDTNEELVVRGGAASGTLGVELGVSRTVAVDVAVSAVGARLTERAFDGEVTDDFEEIDLGAVRLGAGLVWRPNAPSRRRGRR